MTWFWRVAAAAAWSLVGAAVVLTIQDDPPPEPEPELADQVVVLMRIEDGTLYECVHIFDEPPPWECSRQEESP